MWVFFNFSLDLFYLPHAQCGYAQTLTRSPHKAERPVRHPSHHTRSSRPRPTKAEAKTPRRDALAPRRRPHPSAVKLPDRKNQRRLAHRTNCTDHRPAAENGALSRAFLDPGRRKIRHPNLTINPRPNNAKFVTSSEPMLQITKTLPCRPHLTE
jgi:hypothetical protein